SGPYTANQVVAVSSTDNISPLNNTYLAVVAAPGAKAEVAALDFATPSWTTLTVDSASMVDWDTSLAVVNGKPAISYRDAATSTLRFAFSSSLDGSSGWNTIAVGSPGQAGTDNCLAEISGKP